MTVASLVPNPATEIGKMTTSVTKLEIITISKKVKSRFKERAIKYLAEKYTSQLKSK